MASLSIVSPEPATDSKPRAKPQWRHAFLDALAETSNVSEAARRADIPASRAYKARREESAFAEAWHDALLEGYAHLELETLHRLRSGTGREDNKFDIANALRLLMLHRETVARERASRSREDEDSVLASLNARIEAMRSREAQVRHMLAQGADPADGAPQGE